MLSEDLALHRSQNLKTSGAKNFTSSGQRSKDFALRRICKLVNLSVKETRGRPGRFRVLPVFGEMRVRCLVCVMRSSTAMCLV